MYIICIVSAATFDGSLYQEELNSIHTTYQKQLDLLTDKLQKEWMKDPRQKGNHTSFCTVKSHNIYVICI